MDDIMHVIYDGMTHSLPVLVGEPVAEHGYHGFVWTLRADDPDAEPVKTHTSRLHDEPQGV